MTTAPEFEIEPVTFTTSDNYNLSGAIYRPKDPSCAVLISGGTGFPKEFYRHVASHYAIMGALVMLFDYRGIGGSAPDSLVDCGIGYTDWGRLDMPAALDALSVQASGLPIYHLAHSVGGHFAGFMPSDFGWKGMALPKGVFTTWKRWCHNPSYYEDELKSSLRPHHFDAVTAPIKSWIYTDDPIANTETAPDILRCYTKAPSEIVIQKPSELGVKAVGHQSAFRRGNEQLWDQWWNWFNQL
ncbi:alpha/beta hydrolase [Alphaproteobacteria bacterium]|nr:alpha/beta hydrolase [Alphaproteobacteria bacterium]